MRISFDVDDTLVCYHPDVPVEPNRVPWLLRGWLHEPLRLGTRDLMWELINMGCQLSIYTTSYRTPSYMKWWLWFHGIKIHTVINQAIHEQTFQRDGRRVPSKWPSVFGFDLHIDDSDGVCQEGKEFGFDVVVVDPFDRNWTAKVLSVVCEKMADPRKDQRTS